MRILIAMLLLFYCPPLHAQQIQYFDVHYGTGFFVNRDSLITNAHVVNGCTKVVISGAVSSQTADVTVQDDEHDLALIKTAEEVSNFAPLRTDIDELKPGDDVILFGYPGDKGRQGQYSVANAKIERMDINTVGNPWNFYITDVVDHGNSGGPVLDTSGNLIGIVVAKAQLDMINSVTQEKVSERKLGMAISLRALQHFLEDHGVYIQWGGSNLLSYNEGTLEENAKRYIVKVECRLKRDGPPPNSNEESQP